MTSHVSITGGVLADPLGTETGGTVFLALDVLVSVLLLVPLRL